MKTIKTLELAVQVQTRQRDEANAELARARHEREGAMAQLLQLEQYAAETGNALTQEGATHLAARLQHHQSFMQKLLSAIHFQRQVIANHDQRISGLATTALVVSQRIAALESLLDMRRKDLDQRAQRREQRQTDEFASLRHVRMQTALHTAQAAGRI